MRNTFQPILTTILVLLMLITGSFPYWAECAISLILLIQIIEIVFRKSNIISKAKTND